MATPDITSTYSSHVHWLHVCTCLSPQRIEIYLQNNVASISMSHTYNSPTHPPHQHRLSFFLTFFATNWLCSCFALELPTFFTCKFLYQVAENLDGHGQKKTARDSGDLWTNRTLKCVVQKLEISWLILVSMHRTDLVLDTSTLCDNFRVFWFNQIFRSAMIRP